SPLAPNGLHRACQRLGLHHHSRPAAVGHIVHAPVAIRRVVPQVPDTHVEQPTLDRTTNHPFREARLDHARKNRDDVELESFSSSNPAGGLIRIRLAATSMATQMSTASGTCTSPRAPS